MTPRAAAPVDGAGRRRHPPRVNRPGLGRDGFREGVFARDRGRCVVCRGPAQDAHHILERRLFPDGGYVLDNGVSVCGPHHLEAEATTLSCEALRAAAGIGRVVLPPHLHPDRRYDKWGNPVRVDGRRLRGELYLEEPVQKVLAPVLHTFLARSEEPRIPRLPWCADPAEPALSDLRGLTGELVVHAEPPGAPLAVDLEGLYLGTGEDLGDPPPALADLPARLVGLLPPGGRVCGAREGDAMIVTAAWDGRNEALPWDEVTLLAALLELPAAATLLRGPLSPAELAARAPELGPHRVRPAGAFAYASVRRCVARCCP